jgi:hypothetical protein
MQQQRCPEIDFREIFCVVRFSSFSTQSAQSGRSLSSMHERWTRPDAAPSTKGWAKGAMSQSEESTDTGATGDPTNDRTGPMCISRRLLEPCAHGAGLIVAAFSARNILRCVKLASNGGRDTAAALACGKPRAYFFIFLVFLATFLVAFAVFFAFFAMSSSWGWLA